MSTTANRISFLLLFLALVCCCQSANAQGLTGQISGTLTDPDGGVVSNAKSRSDQRRDRAVARGKRDSDGQFRRDAIFSGNLLAGRDGQRLQEV